MIRKTLTTRMEAENYADELRKNGGVATAHKLGAKFRVYAYLKEELDGSEKWRRTPIRALNDLAYEEANAVEDALKLKNLIESGLIYNEYEAVVDSARIMMKWEYLKTAEDVFHFIDNTATYEEKMKKDIEATLEDFDYEAKEEVATG